MSSSSLYTGKIIHRTSQLELKAIFRKFLINKITGNVFVRQRGINNSMGLLKLYKLL
jgi:hypothetical protein